MSRAAGPVGDTQLEAATATVRTRTDLQPGVAMILGSGLGDVIALDTDPEPVVFGFDELAGFTSSNVPGHAKELRLGTLDGVAVAVFSGRIHYYEGHPMGAVTMPARLAAALGAHTLVSTAAVGAVDPGLGGGTLVVLNDHIDLMGASPLRGWVMADGVPPFIDMTSAYDPSLRQAALEEASALGIPVTEGVYAAMAGPTFETPSEIAWLRAIGASVVGMSMVPDVLAARANGLRVLGLAMVANATSVVIDYRDVLKEAAAAAVPAGRLLRDILPVLARAPV